MPKPKHWLSKAQSDLSLSKKGVKGNDTLDSAIYHTQQCAEKALKAYLASKEFKIKRTHDLVVLLEYCMQFDESFIDLRSEAEVLNPFATAFRYPDDYGSVPEREVVLDAIRQASRVFDFVRKKIVFDETGQLDIF